MNKAIKGFLSVLLAAVVLAGLCVSALADGVPNSDQYTVTLSAGNVDGAYIEGKTSWTVTAGATVSFGDVGGLEDSPYYFKGFRPAGHDNNVIYSDRIKVSEDADYVAAYGLRGDLVAYTVNYVLADTGEQMEDSMTHYGNVGDKMVVGSREFDGYQPQAYQLAKTLVADESQNVFTFEYSPVVLPTPAPAAPTATPYVYTEGAQTPAEGGGTEQIMGEPEPLPEPEEPEEPAAEPETAEITDEQTPLNDEPEQMIDLDKTPSGRLPEGHETQAQNQTQERPKTEMQQERAQTQTNFYLSLGLLGVALIAIAVLVVLLVKKKKS